MTWLYGPLQTGSVKPFETDSSPPETPLSRAASFGYSYKKPILKKRSLSELMLQRSLSSSTLIKRATDAVRAQQPSHVLEGEAMLASRLISDYTSPSIPGTPGTLSSVDPPTTLPSASTSGIQTPCTKRHIHFSDKVEQCIAINKDQYYESAIRDDDDSEEDALEIMPVRSKKKFPTLSTPRNSFSSDRKTIAVLPSTTLREDSPRPFEQRSKRKSGARGVASKLSPSPSQETIKPSASSSNFLLYDEDDEADINWQPSSSVHKRDSLNTDPSKISRPGQAADESGEKGLPGTSSSMLMSYEEDENYIPTTGLIGKVVDTVHIAKDVAHVIWNVGWSR